MDTKFYIVFVLSCLAATTLVLSLPQDKGDFNQTDVEIQPRLAFLGRVKNKTFYIERKTASQEIARENCRNMGMELARLDSQSEINEVAGLLTVNDSYIWTDGTLLANETTGFAWSDGSPVISPDRPNSFSSSLGLMLFKNANSDSGYHVDLTTKHHYYLCYL